MLLERVRPAAWRARRCAGWRAGRSASRRCAGRRRRACSPPRAAARRARRAAAARARHARRQGPRRAGRIGRAADHPAAPAQGRPRPPAARRLAPRLAPAADRRRGQAARRSCGGWRRWRIPTARCSKGYVRVTDRHGKTLVHAADARAARAIDLHFADGRVAATVGDALAVAPRRRRVERKGAKPYPPRSPICSIPRNDMLMSGSGAGRQDPLYSMAPSACSSDGDHVLCAMTGRRDPARGTALLVGRAAGSLCRRRRQPRSRAPRRKPLTRLS